uniref:Phosphatidylinositol transfer protein alpha isoform n=1 Tax=Mola mola TaxID=94237 RepID=A0A3Q3VWR7_MOLML
MPNKIHLSANLNNQNSSFLSFQYQVGQLYTVAEASKNETGGGEGVEVIANEPYDENGEKGQFTHKIYYLQSKVPNYIRKLAPSGSLVLHEKAWNAYPYCRTSESDYIHAALGLTVHGLDEKSWKATEVVNIDIGDNSAIAEKDYKEEYDPTLFKSQKTGRGPLKGDWKKELTNNPSCPHMCAYKLVTVEFKMFGLQTMVENFIQKMERRIFTHFHRQLFCLLDKWIDLSMDDIRNMEDETKNELDKMRLNGEARGMTADCS